MPTDQPNLARVSLLWWLAFAAELIAAILETIDKDYMRAAGLYFLTLCFLLLATGGASRESGWRKPALYILAAAAVVLLVIRFALRAQ